MLVIQRSAWAEPSESQAQAEELNSQGKALIKQLDLAGAAQRFRAAMALSSDPRFAFNLCYTLEKSGQFADAKEACEKVVGATDARLANKANKLLAGIEGKMAGEPTSSPLPTPPTQRTPATARAPRAQPVASVPTMAPQDTHKTLQYGAVVGLSRANVSGTELNPDAVVGYAVGGWARMGLRPSFDSIVEAQLVQRGFSTRAFDVSASYLDLGFASRWYLGTGGTKPYLEAGMTLSILLSSEVDLMVAESQELQAYDLAYTIGVGTMIGIGSLSVDVRARYMHGLIAIGEGAGDLTAYNRSVLAQVGMWY